MRRIEGQWQDMDSAPKDGTRILMWVPGEAVTGYYEEGYTHGWVDHRGHNIYPEAWQPLPSPPA